MADTPRDSAERCPEIGDSCGIRAHGRGRWWQRFTSPRGLEAARPAGGPVGGRGASGGLFGWLRRSPPPPAPDALAANDAAGGRDGANGAPAAAWGDARAPAAAGGDAGASARAPAAAKVGQPTSVFGLLMTASHAGLALVSLALTRRTDKTLIASLAFDGTWKAYRRGVNVFDSPDPFFGTKARR